MGRDRWFRGTGSRNRGAAASFCVISAGREIAQKWNEPLGMDTGPKLNRPGSAGCGGFKNARDPTPKTPDGAEDRAGRGVPRWRAQPEGARQVRRHQPFAAGDPGREVPPQRTHGRGRLRREAAQPRGSRRSPGAKDRAADDGDRRTREKTAGNVTGSRVGVDHLRSFGVRVTGGCRITSLARSTY